MAGFYNEHGEEITGGGLYTPQGVTQFTVGGLPAGTDLGTTPVDPFAPGGILDQILYAYRAPTITLATSPSAALRELGDSIASIILNATTVKHSDPIVTVTFFRNASLIHTDTTPNPGGGLETYTDTTPVTTQTAYQAKVDDGTSIVASNIVTFNFVSAYYYGVADPGLDPSVDGGGLTKLVINDTPTLSALFSPVSQVFYFLYPDSYPVLTSIKDTNGFETISDWTLTTGVSITNSFGNVDTYNVYEYNNITTQTNFTNTFIQ